MSDYYTPGGNPGTNTAVSSSPIRAEFLLVDAAFNKFPSLTANPGAILAINAGGTGIVPVTAINAIPIGATTPSTGAFTTLTATTITGHASLDLPLTGGALSGALSAPSFSGPLTGNATTATTLQTPRAINGVAFDGSAPITVADATKLPLAGGTMTGLLSLQVGTGLQNAFNAISGGAVGDYAIGLFTGSVVTGFAGVGNSAVANPALQNAMGFGTQTAHSCVLLTGNTERMRIDASGNVGIGKAPTQKLDVNGTVLATAFSGPLTGNVTGNVSGSSGSTTGNAATATTAATVTTAAQPAITSVGTLTGLTVTAAIAGSVTGSSGSTTGNAATATTAGTVTTAAQPAITSLAAGPISSGTYTPTWAVFTGTGTITAYICQWLRVGNVVTVSGSIQFNSGTSGVVELHATLPIASAFTLQGDCAGVASSSTVSMSASADTTNAGAKLNGNFSAANMVWFFTYTYTVK